jgi:hypothetical protein
MLDGFSLRRWAATFRPSDASPEPLDVEMPIDAWSDGEPDVERWSDNDEQGSGHRPSLSSRAPLPVPHITIQHPSASYFSSGWPAAYLIATVVFAIGLVIGALVHVSQPTSIILPSLANGGHHEVVEAGGEGRESLDSPLPSAVARITGMVDCVWDDQVGWGKRSAAPPSNTANQKSEIRNQKSRLCLGDRIALKSGLLELTYDTGAKVILQGPVRYELESPAGGYLAVGKLTAKLEQRSEVRGRKSESAMQKSEIAHQTFAVRTPTATLTDLGTEFGVEVDKKGQTKSHVFRGLIEVRSTGDDSHRTQPIRLAENESVHVERRPGGRIEVTVRRDGADATGFVRPDRMPQLVRERRLQPFQRWQAYSRQLRKDPALVAYYTFESPGATNATLPNLSMAGSILDGRIEGAEWVNGRWPNKRALYFHGPGSGDRVVLPEQQRFDFAQTFSVAVWFQTTSFRGENVSALIGKGGQTWRLQRFGTTNFLMMDTSGDIHADMILSPHTEVTDGRWHLVVAVVEPMANSKYKRLYLDGRLEAEVSVPLPFRHSNEPVWLGALPDAPDRVFPQRIDEVAVFSRLLWANEIKAMFDAGNPAFH